MDLTCIEFDLHRILAEAEHFQCWVWKMSLYSIFAELGSMWLKADKLKHCKTIGHFPCYIFKTHKVNAKKKLKAHTWPYVYEKSQKIVALGISRFSKADRKEIQNSFTCKNCQ